MVIDNTHSLGRTPVELEEQVWLWTSHSITVRQDGYQPQTIQIRNTGINFGYVAACVCTLGLMLPIAFASEYPKQYVVDLAPSTPEASNEAVREGATVSFR